MTGIIVTTRLRARRRTGGTTPTDFASAMA